MTQHKGFSTRAIHAGQAPEPVTGAIMPPVFLTSTYVQEELGKNKGFEYSRVSNPTRTALEENIAAVAQRYDLSRQRYYQLRQDYQEGGVVALAPEKTGPKTNYRRTDQLVRQILRYRYLDPEISPEVITQKLSASHEILERFRREGEALHKLHHENIVSFVEMFPLGQQYAIVMEYVPGGSLHALVGRGPVPFDRAVRIALELSDALARAHHIGIIHRDVKPENVLLTADGNPQLTDFGVARLVSEITRLTETGTQVGTPFYMSPEAWEGSPLDGQADIWSLGVVFYEMLTGELPLGKFAGRIIRRQMRWPGTPDRPLPVREHRVKNRTTSARRWLSRALAASCPLRSVTTM